jgi:anthranilate phosphoribosyltransferase
MKARRSRKQPRKASAKSPESATASSPGTTDAIQLELKALKAFQRELDHANRAFAKFSYDAILRDSSGNITAIEIKNTNSARHNQDVAEQLKHYEMHFRNFLVHAHSLVETQHYLPRGAIRLFISSAVNEEIRKTDFESLRHFLTKFSDRLPSADELVDGAQTLRKVMIAIKNHTDAIDIVGTGGDGHNTYNISTATAFTVAAQGVKVAKHGNRSASSMSGAADVLETLGVNLGIDKKQASRALAELQISFLFAQTYHQVLKNAAPLRKAIGKRTIFNLLGPLANPAKPKRTLLGVYKRELMRPMAEAMAKLGSERVWVVHGRDGLDEATITDETYVVKYEKGKFSEEIISPQKAGIKRASLDELRGGDAKENAAAMQRLFRGEKGAFRDAVLLNAGMALTVAGKANDIKTGIEMAKDSLGTRKAQRLLADFVKFSQSKSK